MHRLVLLLMLTFFSSSIFAQWVKINDADYVWGPFEIYNLSLFSENGEYAQGMRPLMLTLRYAKPVEGRDFAISLARSWSNLGIRLQDQDSVVDRLRKVMPNVKTNDMLSYIALEDRGYFVLNDIVIPEEFNKEFNDAVVAVWLDPRVEIGRKLLKNVVQTELVQTEEDPQTLSQEQSEQQSNHNDENSEQTLTTTKEQQEILENEGETLSPAQLSNDEKVEQPLENSDPQVELDVLSEMENVVLENNETDQSKQENVSPESISDADYPNPEIEVLPPFDPIPFYSPHK